MRDLALPFVGHPVLADPAFTDRVSTPRHVVTPTTRADHDGVDLPFDARVTGDRPRAEDVRRADDLTPGWLAATGVPAARSSHRRGPRSTRPAVPRESADAVARSGVDTRVLVPEPGHDVPPERTPR
ncbi:hypothetical protein ACOBQX_00755 [Actinokineospora sp. G85]|uniref:hypothetical protein n=1 Tax=Actinokineospora sp. G85 TaxID=3406626 RepID=UPI003C711CC4